MKPGIDLDTKAFEQDLKKFKNAVGTDAITKGLKAAGFVVEGAAKIKAPIDTGFLKNSIQTLDPQVSDVSGHVDVAVFAEYAAHVEYGTVNMEAQPYLRPGTFESKAKANQAIAFQIKKAIEGAV
jgi:HK97 gp10 family phage protein